MVEALGIGEKPILGPSLMPKASRLREQVESHRRACYQVLFVSKTELGTFHFLETSSNPVPNAQVCVYLTIHITKLQLQTTFPKPLYIRHSACIHRDPGR